MPFSQKLLLNVSIFPLLVMIVIGAVLVSISGLFIFRKIVPQRVMKSHNELTGALFEAIGMAYTVLLAFVVVVAWQNFDKSIVHLETEANCIVDLHRDSAAFAPDIRDSIRMSLEEYARIVVQEEWVLLARGQESMNARHALRKVWEVYTNYEPRSDKESAFFAESISKLDELREARRLRIVDSRPGVHPILWFVLIVGAIATISFAFFFGADSFTAHAVMVATLSVIVCLILFTILLFDYPFTGSMGIGPKVFQEIVNF